MPRSGTREEIHACVLCMCKCAYAHVSVGGVGKQQFSKGHEFENEQGENVEEAGGGGRKGGKCRREAACLSLLPS